MPNLPSGRLERLSNDEVLQRAVSSKKQTLPSRGKARPNLFTPHPHKELSVSRVSDLEKLGELLSDEERKALADFVAKKRGKDESYGEALISVMDVNLENLEVLPDESPLEDGADFRLHHANIKGWEENSDEDKKRLANLEIARRLAEKAKLNTWA